MRLTLMHRRCHESFHEKEISIDPADISMYLYSDAPRNAELLLDSSRTARMFHKEKHSVDDANDFS